MQAMKRLRIFFRNLRRMFADTPEIGMEIQRLRQEVADLKRA